MSSANEAMNNYHCNSNGSSASSVGSVNNNFSNKPFNLESRFECGICLSCLKDPLITSCGHRFCKMCINSWLKRQGSCPMDGKTLSPDRDLFPDNCTSREIANQLIECPFSSTCTRGQVPLLEIEQHILQVHENGSLRQGDMAMNGESVACLFKSVRCNHIFTSKEQMLAHCQDHLQYHLQLIVKEHSRLSYAEDAKSAIKMDSTPQSYERGSAYPGVGPHRDLSVEAELWTPPSKNTSPHATCNPDDLIETMYKRIVLLEQSKQELEIKLNNLSLKLDNFVSLVTTENTKLKTELPLRMCQGVYIWKINNFSMKKKEMSKDTSVMYYSEGFYTSYTGYRFCARMNISPNDERYLSLLVHLMKGDNDQTLSWPFSGRIAMTLIHPHCQEKAVREVMCSRPELEAFKRPVMNIAGRSFGYTEFVKLADITSQGYVDPNDNLLVKLEISCV